MFFDHPQSDQGSDSDSGEGSDDFELGETSVMRSRVLDLPPSEPESNRQFILALLAFLAPPALGSVLLQMTTTPRNGPPRDDLPANTGATLTLLPAAGVFESVLGYLGTGGVRVLAETDKELHRRCAAWLAAPAAAHQAQAPRLVFQYHGHKMASLHSEATLYFASTRPLIQWALERSFLDQERLLGVFGYLSRERGVDLPSITRYEYAGAVPVQGIATDVYLVCAPGQQSHITSVFPRRFERHLGQLLPVAPAWANNCLLVSPDSIVIFLSA